MPATVPMTGNVLLTQGDNALTSEEMTVNLDDGTAQMSGRVSIAAAAATARERS